MIDIYVGLGSNLNRPIEQVKQASIALSKHPHLFETTCSSLYSSPPMGPQDQPDYINAVVAAKTDLSAIDLLRALQEIENDFGRTREGERWGARILDLDLLLYADQEINIPDLIVPHSGMSSRSFVMYPLAEIAPEYLVIPGKSSVKSLLSTCPLDGLEKLV
jgi:2-amino-4-hydroxy-6-hydroxymethyldihydropteridine diphosphokinase